MQRLMYTVIWAILAVAQPASAGDTAEKTSLLRIPDAALGTWAVDFRLCVDAQESEGIPAQEARRTCSEGLSPFAPQPLTANTAWEQTAAPTLGSWAVEFRLCVDAQESEGIPAQEARRTCSEGP